MLRSLLTPRHHLLAMWLALNVLYSKRTRRRRDAKQMFLAILRDSSDHTPARRSSCRSSRVAAVVAKDRPFANRSDHSQNTGGLR